MFPQTHANRCSYSYVSQLKESVFYDSTMRTYLLSDAFAPQIIDQEINPHVDQWEAEKQFPAHKIFKILGNAGFLGVNKPVGETVFWQPFVCYLVVGTPRQQYLLPHWCV